MYLWCLKAFLLRVGSHPILSNDPGFVEFLQAENLDTSGRDIWEKADAKLKHLTASLRLHEPNKFFEELRNYSTDLGVSYRVLFTFVLTSFLPFSNAFLRILSITRSEQFGNDSCYESPAC